MLVEFRVTNFRSLRDEQVLSLVASKDKTLEGSHTVSTGVKAVPRLLKSAVIYGANAGGKSNVIKALQFVRAVIVESATVVQPGQTYAVEPYRLNADSAGQPTEFEVTVILDGVRYQYGFALTADRIVREHLLVYKAAKPQHWFERYLDAASGREVYEYGAGLKGAKHVWEGATRPNALFLSMAVQLNSEALRPLFDWFANDLVIFNEHAPLSPQSSMEMLRQPEGRKRICEFLTSADISISDVEVVNREKTDVRADDIDQSDLRFLHVTERGSAVLGLADESSGTRNLLFLAGPILNILRKGQTLVIDELDTSLHTLLVRALARLFHQPEANIGCAQLIFTTHDTALLDAPDMFRRDQIWFVEKDADQASTLVALSEFSPRKNEALGRGYLLGRYGGVPFLQSDLAMMSDGT